MSLNQHYYAKTLVGRDKIKIDCITDMSIFFKVNSKEEYSIIWNKEQDKWSCTCIFFSSFAKGKKDLVYKECSHIKACKLFLDKTKYEL